MPHCKVCEVSLKTGDPPTTFPSTLFKDSMKYWVIDTITTLHKQITRRMLKNRALYQKAQAFKVQVQ